MGENPTVTPQNTARILAPRKVKKKKKKWYAHLTGNWCAQQPAVPRLLQTLQKGRQASRQPGCLAPLFSLFCALLHSTGTRLERRKAKPGLGKKPPKPSKVQRKKADAQGGLRRAGGAARPCPLGRGGVLCPLSSPIGPCERREQRERCEDARRWNNEFIAACHPAKAISTIRHCKLLLKGERASPHHHSHPVRPAPNQMGEGGREREKEGACSRKGESGTEKRTRRGGRRDRRRVCFGVSVRAGPRLGVWKPGVPLAAFKATAALGWSCLFHNQWGVLGLPPFQKGCWSNYLTSFKSLLTSLPFLLFFCLGRKFLPQVFFALLAARFFQLHQPLKEFASSRAPPHPALPGLSRSLVPPSFLYHCSLLCFRMFTGFGLQDSW